MTQTPKTAPVAGEDAEASAAKALGRRLRIRSMVTMAGEVLPFFWPMRNFIHHNPLHGLEHLPFEQAVAEASRLFHARGWLRRTDYQRLLADGSIDRAVLEEVTGELVDAWLAEHCGAVDPELPPLLKRVLMAMLTQMDQPAAGDREPCAEEVLACLRAAR